MVPELRRVIVGPLLAAGSGGIRWFPWLPLLLVGVGLGIAGVLIRSEKKGGGERDEPVPQPDPPAVEDTAATGESPIVHRPAPPAPPTSPSPPMPSPLLASPPLPAPSPSLEPEAGPTGADRVPPRPPRPPRPRPFRPRSGATGPRSVTRSQNPVDFFHANYPPDIARPVARAWQMADQMLGGRADGVAGSYARGCPRVGEWPVATARDAWILANVPTDLSPEVAAVLPSQVQSLRDLRLQLGADGIPSDLDVITPVTDEAALGAAREAIFDETGISVDFVQPMPE